MAVTGKILNHVLKKFMTAEVTKEARVQIELPNGELYDLKEVQLLENVPEFRGQGWKIGLYSVLLIYWAMLLAGPFLP